MTACGSSCTSPCAESEGTGEAGSARPSDRRVPGGPGGHRDQIRSELHARAALYRSLLAGKGPQIISALVWLSGSGRCRGRSDRHPRRTGPGHRAAPVLPDVLAEFFGVITGTIAKGRRPVPAAARALWPADQASLQTDRDPGRAPSRSARLLPGLVSCLAIVTSRDQLSGAGCHGRAQLLTLDVLSEGGVAELLAARLGAQRRATEPAAVAALTRLWGGCHWPRPLLPPALAPGRGILWRHWPPSCARSAGGSMRSIPARP
jgi:hypothetical protein